MAKLIAIITLLVGFMTASNAGGISPAATPDARVVLRVHVTRVDFTNQYPGQCAASDDCIPMHFWFKYKAKVEERISGNWKASEVEFAHVQHTEYVPEVTRDCYVVLHPADKDVQSKLGVAFVAENILSTFLESDRAAIQALRNGT